MKIDDLDITTEAMNRNTAPSWARSFTSHMAAVPSVISGMWGDEKGRETATERIARGKFVNDFTNKFLALLDDHFKSASQQQPVANYGKGGAGVPNTSVTPTFKSTQQPKVKESFESKLDTLLNEQQGQIPVAAKLKEMIASYMTGYDLKDAKVIAEIDQICRNIEINYNTNTSPVGQLRKLGDLLFTVIMIQKKTSQPKQQNAQPKSDQLDAQAQEAINIITSLGSRNNTYAVALASLKQLRKADPAAYAKLMVSVNNT
jgi:hypothetical protein